MLQKLLWEKYWTKKVARRRLRTRHEIVRYFRSNWISRSWKWSWRIWRAIWLRTGSFRMRSTGIFNLFYKKISEFFKYAKELINALPSWNADKTIFSGIWDPQGNPEQCSNSGTMPDRMLTASQMSENDLQMLQMENGGRPRPAEDDPAGVMTRPLMMGLWQNTRELIESKQESG